MEQALFRTVPDLTFQWQTEWDLGRRLCNDLTVHFSGHFSLQQPTVQSIPITDSCIFMNDGRVPASSKNFTHAIHLHKFTLADHSQKLRQSRALFNFDSQINEAVKRKTRKCYSWKQFGSQKMHLLVKSTQTWKSVSKQASKQAGRPTRQ